MDDATIGKPFTSSKKIKVMMTGASQSIRTKLQKITTAVEESLPASTLAEVDGEALERVRICREELTGLSTRVVALREQVIAKSEELNALEMKARDEAVAGVDGDDADDASTTDTSTLPSNSVASMSTSMTKLGGSLVMLAQTMPDKMEGFAKTIEAVQDDRGREDDVTDAIKGNNTNAATTAAASAAAAAQERSRKSDASEKSFVDSANDGADDNQEEEEEEEEGSDDDAEDMFASMVGR
jgi:hypothetical protein